MSPSESWTGAIVAGQIVDAAHELHASAGRLPSGAAEHVEHLRVASREASALISRVTRVAERVGTFVNLSNLSGPERHQFENFFGTFAKLQQALVDVDLDVLRALCLDGSFEAEIDEICDAMRVGQSLEATRRLEAISQTITIDSQPAAMIHAVETYRAEWYDFDHDPLRIGRFLMIDSEDRLRWFCDQLRTFEDIVSGVRMPFRPIRNR